MESLKNDLFSALIKIKSVYSLILLNYIFIIENILKSKIKNSCKMNM